MDSESPNDLCRACGHRRAAHAVAKGDADRKCVACPCASYVAPARLETGEAEGRARRG